MIKSNSGFTIVELLIVIVVIAILATISLVSYNGIQTRAKATAIATDLKATEKALIMYRTFSGQSDWWPDESTALTGASNPKIKDIISAQPALKDLLREAPTTSGLDTPNSWYYDNDGDIYDGCSANTAGPNLSLFNPQNTALVQAIDTAIDDGNLSCGRVRKAGSSFVYALY